MKLIFLSDFAEKIRISFHKFKTKYGDCIRREGCKSFIDWEKLKKKFSEFAKLGTRTRGGTERLQSINQVGIRLNNLSKQIKGCEQAVTYAKEIYQTESDDTKKELKIQNYLQAKKKLTGLKVRHEELIRLRNRLIQR